MHFEIDTQFLITMFWALMIVLEAENENAICEAKPAAETRWGSKEGREMIRRLAAMRMREAAMEQQRARADAASGANRSFLARIWEYFTAPTPPGSDGMDPQGELRHNCFFTAANCRFGPRARVPPGAVRVRVTDAERRAMLAAALDQRKKQNSDQ